MNIFHIIIAKVSATLTVIMLSLGFVSSPVVTPLAEDPVQVVVATATSTQPEEAKPSITVQFLKPKVVVASTPTSTVTTTEVVVATTSPVVVPESALPTTNEVASTPIPQTVVIQIQQPEAPVASAPVPTMGKTYTLNKGEQTILSTVSEGEIRKFAESLNAQTNWRKQVRTVDIETLSQALESNGYTLVEN